VPSLCLHVYTWRRVEKGLIGLFCAKNGKSRPERFQTANGPLREFRKKIFPATQNRSLEGPPRYDLALEKRFSPRVLSLITRRLSRRSSIRRLDEIRFAPIDLRARCEISTASKIVPIFSASSTLDIGVTSKVNPGILDKARTAVLTYRPTLVPAPIGWMLNSAITTIRLFAFGCTDNRYSKQNREGLVFTN
jgi:hypothetical protein